MTCQVSPSIGICAPPARQPLVYSPITLDGCAEGRYFRAKSCLAPIFGSLGCSSGGNGCGFTVPLSCASAGRTPAANAIRTRIRIGRACIRLTLFACHWYREEQALG